MAPMLPRVFGIKLSSIATLVIALCYMTNALVNRPQSTKDFLVLSDTCSVHEKVHEILTPVRPLHIFALHSLCADNCPRISTHRTLEISVIARLCGIKGGASKADISALFEGTDRARPTVEEDLPVWGPEAEDSEVTGPGNAGSKRARACVVVQVSRAKRLKLFLGENDAPAVAADEIGIPEPRQDDNGAASEEEDPEAPSTTVTNRGIMNDIFNKMAGEMILKLSARRSSENECHRLRYPTLCNSGELSRLLKCWRQISNHPAWAKTIKKLFPTRSEFKAMRTDRKGKPKKTFLQGLAQCSWFQDWNRLMSNANGGLTENELSALVTFTRKKISREAQWLPLGKADRMWSTEGAPGDAIVHGQGDDDQGAFVVVLNPAFCTNLDLPGGH
jgi:hypothetical protein